MIADNSQDHQLKKRKPETTLHSIESSNTTNNNEELVYLKNRELEQEQLINECIDSFSKLSVHQIQSNLLNHLSSPNSTVTATTLIEEDKKVKLTDQEKEIEIQKELYKINQLKRMQLDEQVILNVGGKLFYSTKRTLLGEGHLTNSNNNNQEEEIMKDDNEKKTMKGQKEKKKKFPNNLFKVMFESGFKIDTEINELNQSIISFPESNPDYFEYILEHLRQNGKVKSLGIELKKKEELEGILKEAEFFLCEKLSKFILELLTKIEKEEEKNKVPTPRLMTDENEKLMTDNSSSAAVSIKNEELLVVTKDKKEEENEDEQLNNEFKKLNIIEYLKEKEEIIIEKAKHFLSEKKQQSETEEKEIIEKSKKLKEVLKNYMSNVNNNEMSDNNNELENNNDFNYITITVSNVDFSLPIKVFKENPDFLIGKYILSDNFILNENGKIFIDRNPNLFQLIYSYLLNQNFNNFPNLSENKKAQLKNEIKFYNLKKMLTYFDKFRYPIELIGKENIKLKEQEDKLRELFAKDRNNPLLEDKYLLLTPLFSILNEIDDCNRFNIDFKTCPKILELTDKLKYPLKSVEPFKLVKNLNVFKKNWNAFTKTVFHEMNWNNIFAAGGGVLSCCLESKPFVMPAPMDLNEEGKEEENGDSDREEDSEEEGFGEEEENVDEELTEEEQERKQLLLKAKQQEEENKLKTWEDGSFGRYNDYYFRNLQQQANNNNSGITTNTSMGGFSFGGGLFGATPTMPTITPLGFPTMGGGIGGGLMFGATPIMPTGLFGTVPTGTTSLGFAPIVQEYVPPPNYGNSDIDLFLYDLTVEQAEDKLRYIYQTIKENLKRMSLDDNIFICRTRYAVTFHCIGMPPIQVVTRIYKSPAEILLGFDIDAATIGFDGEVVWSAPRNRRALAHRVNLIDVDRQSTTYEYRLFKYAKRGFAVSVPGFEMSKVKNQHVTYPRKYRVRHLPVFGLAKLIAIDAACGYARKRAAMLLGYEDSWKIETREIFEKGGDRNKSDYMDLHISKIHYSPKILYDRFDRNRGFFKNLKEEKGELNWKPYFVFSLNDIETVIDDSTLQSSRLPNKIEWKTIDPGTQRIGSFNPTTRNFYLDAYTKSPFPSTTSLSRRREYKSFYSAQWSWLKNQRNGTYENYSPKESNIIEDGYRKYVESVNKDEFSEVNINDDYKICFKKMLQINRHNTTKTRRINRQYTNNYRRVHTLQPIIPFKETSFY